VAAVDGFLYAVGYTFTSGVPNSEDYLVQKYDENGNLLWSQSSGGAATDVLNGIVGLRGRVFAVGYTRSQGSGGADAVLLEIDPATGNTRSTSLFGGALDDLANGVVTDGTDLYAVGESRSFATPEGNPSVQNDLVVLRVIVGDRFCGDPLPCGGHPQSRRPGRTPSGLLVDAPTHLPPRHCLRPLFQRARDLVQRRGDAAHGRRPLAHVPGRRPLPLTSSINYSAGATRANNGSSCWAPAVST
jgi:hypothetical protein